jgi:hypothetical protein
MDTRYRQQDFDGEFAELVRPLRKAFSSLRLFADSNNPLPAERLITHARRVADDYRSWEDSGAPLSGLVVRLNDREEVEIIKPNSRIMTIPWSGAESPPGSVLKVYKQADEQFIEVLLFAVEVDGIPPDGIIFRKTYPNKQSLFLHIELEEGEQLKVSVNYTPAQELAREASFSISVGVTEPNVREYMASTPRFFNILTWAWGRRPSYALAVALCIFMVTLGLNVLPRKHGLVESPRPEQARGFIQKDPLTTLNTLAANIPEYGQSSNNTTKDEIRSQQPIIHGRRYYASSLDDPSARTKYCVVGEFEGRARDNKRIIDVTLSGAKLNLCSYSVYGARRIAIKIGVMNASGIRGGETGNVLWSRSVTLAERLNPGETFSLSNSVGISIPKRGSVDMSNAKFVIQVISMPYDSNRKSHSYLSEVEVA